MKKNIFFFFILFVVTELTAQNVGIGTTTPNESALLHLTSSNKGLLIPQVSIDSLKDITSIPSPTQGLLVYNTTQPGSKSDMQRGFYYYSSVVGTWIRMADNYNDNVWQNGGTLGIQLRDKTDGVEIMDNYIGTQTNFSPKVKILKMIDSSLMNSKNNITALVISGVERKSTAGWESGQKTTVVFENNYITTDGVSSGTYTNAAISSYLEGSGTTTSGLKAGLAFYTTAPPPSAVATNDTPSLSLLRHNVSIGAYATDINNVTEGRLQITGYSNGDQLSLRHPSSINLKWGLYVSAIDSSLNFYSNGSLRANIDRVTGVYSSLSDKTLKKNIRPLYATLNSIMQLPAYSFNYLDNSDTDKRAIGFMAQDVLPYFPELVYLRKDRETGNPFYMMNYAAVGVVAVKAIQEQQKIIDNLKKRIEFLEKK